jgi:hypothetical protein
MSNEFAPNSNVPITVVQDNVQSGSEVEGEFDAVKMAAIAADIERRMAVVTTTVRAIEQMGSAMESAKTNLELALKAFGEDVGDDETSAGEEEAKEDKPTMATDEDELGTMTGATLFSIMQASYSMAICMSQYIRCGVESWKQKLFTVQKQIDAVGGAFEAICLAALEPSDAAGETVSTILANPDASPMEGIRDFARVHLEQARTLFVASLVNGQIRAKLTSLGIQDDSFWEAVESFHREVVAKELSIDTMVNDFNTRAEAVLSSFKTLENHGPDFVPNKAQTAANWAVISSSLGDAFQEVVEGYVVRAPFNLLHNRLTDPSKFQNMFAAYVTGVERKVQSASAAKADNVAQPQKVGEEKAEA